jgi:hypothetical protein
MTTGTDLDGVVIEASGGCMRVLSGPPRVSVEVGYPTDSQLLDFKLPAPERVDALKCRPCLVSCH